MLDAWEGQVVDLISLIDDTCHLIHRHVIAHRVNDAKVPNAAPAPAAAAAAAASAEDSTAMN